MTLGLSVFQHSPDSFSATSTLIYGERDAILVDAPFLLSDAHRLAAGLLEMGKNLTHIYVSHFHPDHHFGLGVLHYAFPSAKIVAMPSVVKDMVYSADDKIHLWGKIFGKNVPDTMLFPMPVLGGRLQLEGEDVEFSDDWDGDSANNTVVWIPSLRTALGTDVVFLDAYLWTIESDEARRMKWRKSLQQMRAMDPAVVIPGHVSPEKLALRDTSGIDFSLKYLDVYEEVLATAKSGDELVEGLQKRYPGMTTMLKFVHWQASLLFPNHCSDRIIKAPGMFMDPRALAST